jgi:hypothetical protein
VYSSGSAPTFASVSTSVFVFGPSSNWLCSSHARSVMLWQAQEFWGGRCEASLCWIILAQVITFRLRTVTVLPAALCRAVDSARRRSFLFIFMLQSFGCREVPIWRVSKQGPHRPVAAHN